MNAQNMNARVTVLFAAFVVAACANDGTSASAPASVPSGQSPATPAAPASSAGEAQPGSVAQPGSAEANTSPATGGTASTPPPAGDEPSPVMEQADAAAPPPTTNAGDDPDTKGNDAPGHVSCGDAVADCDMEGGSNCCVSAAMTTDCRQGDCGFGDTTTACDGPEDCGAGEVCCTHVNVPLGVTSSCEPPNPVANGSRCAGGSTIGDFELCHTDADCDPTSFCDGEGDGTFPWWAFCAASP